MINFFNLYNFIKRYKFLFIDLIIPIMMSSIDMSVKKYNIIMYYKFYTKIPLLKPFVYILYHKKI